MDLLRTKFSGTVLLGYFIGSALISGCQVPNQGRVFGPESEAMLSSQEESLHPRSPRHKLARSLRQERQSDASAARHQPRSQAAEEIFDGMSLAMKRQESVPSPDRPGPSVPVDVSSVEDRDTSAPIAHSLRISDESTENSLTAKHPSAAERHATVSAVSPEEDSFDSGFDELGTAAPAPIVSAESLAAKPLPATQPTQASGRDEGAVVFAGHQSPVSVAPSTVIPVEEALQDLVAGLQAKLVQLGEAGTAAANEEIAQKAQVLRGIEEEIQAAQTRAQQLGPQVQASLQDTLAQIGELKEQITSGVAQIPAKIQGETQPLRVLNPAFCTEVESFGVIKRFPEYRFRAGEQVLLYCELENFVSRSVDREFETQLGGKYEILDEQGQIVQELKLPRDVDKCRNLRRDFYIAYRLDLPGDVSPGFYQLRLTIDDIHGQQSGNATVDFVIVP